MRTEKKNYLCSVQFNIVERAKIAILAIPVLIK
jgi:hypothetical protein